MGNKIIAGKGFAQNTVPEKVNTAFDPSSPQFRLKSISKHLQDLINIYKNDKSPFNRADLNDRAAHAKSLIKEAKAKGADINTIALVENLIDQSTVLLRSDKIAFGKPTQVPQIPYIPQVKLSPPLIPRTGNGIIDGLATLPNGGSILATAFTGGAINGVASIPNAGSGLINGIIKLPTKITDTFTVVQRRTGATSAVSFGDSFGRHWVYNRLIEADQMRKKNKKQDAEFKKEKKEKGTIPAYSEALFGWAGSTVAQIYVGGKVFGKAPKATVKPKGLPGTPSAKSSSTSGSQTPPRGGSQKTAGNTAPGNGTKQTAGGSNKPPGSGKSKSSGGSNKSNRANEKSSAQQPPKKIDIKLDNSLQKLGFKQGQKVTAAEAKARYNQLQRELHPDINPASAEANKARLLEVNNAYDYLKVNYDIKRLSPDAVLVPK